MSKQAIAKGYRNDSEMARAIGMSPGGNIARKLEGYGIRPVARLLLGQGSSARIMRLYTQRQQERAERLRRRERAGKHPELRLSGRPKLRACERRFIRDMVGAK